MTDMTPDMASNINDTQRAESIPVMNSFESPPERLVVPMKISKASDLGIDAEATEMAITKLPKMPMFWRVRRRPDMLPYDPVRALAITALLLAG
jgi:hypothetical protein